MALALGHGVQTALVSTLLTSIVALATSGAQAQSPSAEPSSAVPRSQQRVVNEGHTERSRSRVSTRWYGWQTLATDGAAFGMLGVAAAAHSSDGDTAVPIGTAAGIYALGGPAVHLAHGRPGVAAGSLALRTLPPVLLFGLVKSSKHCDGLDDGEPGGCTGAEGFEGAVAGIVIAVVVDAALLAHERAPEAEPRLGKDTRWTAGFATVHGGAKLVLSGSL